MYRVLKKNIAKIPDTARNMTTFAVRSERILKIDSRTSGAFVLSSMTTKLASRTNASANRPSVLADPQPADWAPTIPYTSTIRPPVTVTAPAMS